MRGVGGGVGGPPLRDHLWQGPPLPVTLGLIHPPPQTMGSYLSGLDVLWPSSPTGSAVACDLFGRRWVIPAFAVPAGILLIVMGHLDGSASLFLGGAGNELPDHWQLWYGPRLYRRASSRPRSAAPASVRPSPSALTAALGGADDHGLDRDRLLSRRRPAAACGLCSWLSFAALHLVCARHDPQGAHRLRRPESRLNDPHYSTAANRR